MGILSKFLPGDEVSNSVTQAAPATSEPRAPDNASQPSSPCPQNHTPPYGLNFWRDSYDTWHCYDCSPPASLAMVKDEVFLGSGANQNHAGHSDAGHSDAQQPLTQANFQLSTGFEILAVQSPAGVWAFAPEATQAQRREAVENAAWFERADKSEREKRPPRLMKAGFGGR